MNLLDVIIEYKKYNIMQCLPCKDPYKANCRQCIGKCPYQKFNKIVLK